MRVCSSSHVSAMRPDAVSAGSPAGAGVGAVEVGGAGDELIAGATRVPGGDPAATASGVSLVVDAEEGDGVVGVDDSRASACRRTRA
ncbi:hypothetical protein GCM10027411_16840 [Microbacterium aureliae]